MEDRFGRVESADVFVSLIFNFLPELLGFRNSHLEVRPLTDIDIVIQFYMTPSIPGPALCVMVLILKNQPLSRILDYTRSTKPHVELKADLTPIPQCMFDTGSHQICQV